MTYIHSSVETEADDDDGGGEFNSAKIRNVIIYFIFFFLHFHSFLRFGACSELNVEKCAQYLNTVLIAFAKVFVHFSILRTRHSSSDRPSARFVQQTNFAEPKICSQSHWLKT